MPLFQKNSDLSAKLSILLPVLSTSSQEPIEEEIGANSGICFREIMRTVGVQKVEDILQVDYPENGEDKPTRNLLVREDSVAGNDGTVLYENRTRNNTISSTQQAIDTVSESFPFGEHY